jgi:thiosulfate dehydrogenase [quinone] large subunit
MVTPALHRPATPVIDTPRAGSSVTPTGTSPPAHAATASTVNHPVGAIALVGLRLALGFLFLWAFLDKTFGLGYATPSSKSWLNGGSPTHGFLSGANVGPLQGFFRDLAKLEPGMDWLFMIGLLGIGAALILGVALRPAAAAGALLVMMMWFAVWPPATTGGGQPTASTNPIIDEHILEALALIVVAAFAGRTAGYLGRRWGDLGLVRRFPVLR